MRRAAQGRLSRQACRQTKRPQVNPLVIDTNVYSRFLRGDPLALQITRKMPESPLRFAHTTS